MQEISVAQDPQEAIRQIIYENWNLHGALSRDRMGDEAFNTGIPAASRRYPSIEIVPLVDEHRVLSTAWWRMTALIHVHVWVRPKTTDPKALSKAKNDRRYLLHEIKRILHLNSNHVEGTEWVEPGTEINADQYHGLDGDSAKATQSTGADSRGFFPVLHSIIPVRAVRFHNKYA